VVSNVSALVQFEYFFRSEYPSVYRAVYLATGSEEAAEDATQEAFERAFARWRRLSRQHWVGGWVMTTALNAGKRTSRRRRPDPFRDTSEQIVKGPSPASVDVSLALQHLPFRQRQAVLLFYLGDFPLPVVAHLMGISEGTVKAHLAQARDALRNLLGDAYA
jgi:RNA polymerase sigma-70 factor (ECF subfamily)